VHDGELTHEQRDENDSKNFVDSDDAHILLKWGGSLQNAARGENFPKVQMTPLRLSTKEYWYYSSQWGKLFPSGEFLILNIKVNSLPIL